MKILFVVPYTPNLIRSRSYNVIRTLAERGHAVHLVTLWTSEEERKSVAELKKHCRSVRAFSMPAWRSLANCLVALPTSQPLQAWYSWNPRMAEQLLTCIQKEKIDIVHVEHLRGAKYAMYLTSKMANNGGKEHAWAPVVWDSVDCISYLFRQSSVQSKRQVSRWISQLELKRTEKFEAKLTQIFPAILITTQKDKEALLALKEATPETSKVNVFPIGVDLEYFRPDPQQKREPATLLVSGKMSYHANVSMAVHLFEHIMPQVWAQRPEVRLWIVGKDPPQEVKDMAAHPNVTVTGMVPDMRPYLQRAAIAAAPLTYGAGMQFKVIENMACGTPVVATPLAVSALSGVVPDQDVMVAQEPGEFAEKIIRLLDDADLRQAVGDSGRSYVEQHFSWDRIVANLEEVYHGVVEINGTALQG